MQPETAPRGQAHLLSAARAGPPPGSPRGAQVSTCSPVTHPQHHTVSPVPWLSQSSSLCSSLHPNVLSGAPALRAHVTPASSFSSNAPSREPSTKSPRPPIPAGDGELMPGGEQGKGRPVTRRCLLSYLQLSVTRFLSQTAA